MKREHFLVAPGLVLLLIIISCGGESLRSSRTVTASQTATTQSAAPKVSLTVSPAEVWLGAGKTQQFTAVVTGISDQSVTWNVSCSPGDNCGTVDASGMYSAPATVNQQTMLWIQATPKGTVLQANAGLVRLMPISVAVSPNTPENLLPGAGHSFEAFIRYDAQNSGVSWALSGDCLRNSCGTLSAVTGTSVVYNAPAAALTGSVTLTATSVTDSSKSDSTSFTVSEAPSILLGKYAFMINGWRREGDIDTIEAIAGQFEADGKGNLSGVWDANRGAAVIKAQPISGSYNLQPDGRGTLELHSGTSTWTYAMALDSNRKSARLVESTPPSSGLGDLRGASGYLVMQDASSFAPSSTQGDRVIALSGEANCCHLAALGRFTNLGGSLANTAMDLSWVLHDSGLQFPNSVALSGSVGMPDFATGRGTASLVLAPGSGAPASYSFAYYIVSAERMLLVQTDTPGGNAGSLVPTLSGEIQKQFGAGTFTNASLNVPLIFHLNNSSPFLWCAILPAATVGQMRPDGAGAVSTTFDQNEGGDVLMGTIVNGTYSVAASGRVSLDAGMYTNFDGAKIWVHTAVAYLVDQNKGYVMQGGMMGGAIGAFEPQTGTPFSSASLAGTYLFYTDAPTTVAAQNDIGWLTVTEDGSVTGTVYVNGGTGLVAHQVTGTLTMTSNGSGSLLLESPSPPLYVGWGSYVLWFGSPTHALALIPGGEMSELFHLRRIEN